MSTPLRAVRPNARPLASRAAFGFGTGMGLGAALGALAWLADQLPYPWETLIPANAIGAWLAVGFLLGASARTVPTGALRGLIGLLTGVAAYYALISIFAVGFRLIGASHAATTWGAVALVAGPLFGAAGGAWRHWQGTGRAFAVSLLAASLIAEGVAFGKLRTDDAVAIFYLIEIAIGLLLPIALLRPRERLVGYGATLVLAVAMGIAIEPITVLVRSIADRF
ncbi:MAG TPA: DUF6518 family protein [Candidatus Limnocylindrales bacterium]|nr:DUF6518 family protein [Candidatus Limnocylindrales bacterium]